MTLNLSEIIQNVSRVIFPQTIKSGVGINQYCDTFRHMVVIYVKCSLQSRQNSLSHGDCQVDGNVQQPPSE